MSAHARQNIQNISEQINKRKNEQNVIIIRQQQQQPQKQLACKFAGQTVQEIKWMKRMSLCNNNNDFLLNKSEPISIPIILGGSRILLYQLRYVPIFSNQF